MKKNYEKPEIEEILLRTEDIILTSGSETEPGGADETEDDGEI